MANFDEVKKVYQVYLIDVDTISDMERKTCTLTKKYSPGFLLIDENGNDHLEAISYCNHALDLY